MFSVYYFCFVFFFFNETATTEIYTTYGTLSLHDALPILLRLLRGRERVQPPQDGLRKLPEADVEQAPRHPERDEPSAIVADIGADAHRQHRDLRLVER